MQIKTKKNITILLVEDNPADQKLTERAFKKSQFPVDLKFAGDGEIALEYLNKVKENIKGFPEPDIILMDINLPKMDGKQALKIIKQDAKWSSIPVIMLTTSEHEKDVMESYQLGVNAYLSKPINHKEFVNVIQKFEDFWLTSAILPPKYKTKKEFF